jgi:hypothetical protein
MLVDKLVKFNPLPSLVNTQKLLADEYVYVRKPKEYVSPSLGLLGKVTGI